uniref:Uncharacterized protein n=1 Tax=Parascaris univalens TaxID=6257 RepID=A0A915A891_PARUN
MSGSYLMEERSICVPYCIATKHSTCSPHDRVVGMLATSKHPDKCDKVT